MSETVDWAHTNDQHLAAVVAWIRLRLESIDPSTPKSLYPEPQPQPEPATGSWFRRSKPDEKLLPVPKPVPQDEAIKRAWKKIKDLEEHTPPPALVLLANHLALSEFDCHVLALCAAVELDTRVAALCAKAQDDPGKPYPTFALAFALFDEPDWNSLSPHGPLRYWRLIQIHQPGPQPLTSAALSADERIVNYLKGVNYLDDRIAPLTDSVPPPASAEPLADSQQQIVDQIVKYAGHTDDRRVAPVIELLGHDTASKRLVAAQAAMTLNTNLYATRIRILPEQVSDMETFARLWQRECLLLPLALLIEFDDTSEVQKTQLQRFLKRCNGIVFLDCINGDKQAEEARVSVEVSKPTADEQQLLWNAVLQDQHPDLGKRLAEQFSFDQGEITRLAGLAAAGVAAAETESDDTESDETDVQAQLWAECRVSARAGMAQLAQRIDTKALWAQLVLPEEQKNTLQHLTEQVAQRNRVYKDWGFREQMNRGLGINALFTGESGTGKTMAAEVIANVLGLDLYRIDLSRVVNKYIGETEKNLRRLFDAAEDSGAILFFDEADALFGKRSEVKDSHDRYANIEINYLLQRMESYQGLAILATNMKSALDKAFVRRLRFIVNFPFPDVQERAEIWKKVFPPETPVADDVDYQRLARLHLTGGNIHNVALNAAFLGAHANSQVTMPLILEAARMEFKKLERPMKETDFRWHEKATVTA